MGLFNLFKPARTVLVVDAIALNESMGMKGKVPPRNQLQILRRLARFSQREKLDVVAVLTGSPLNKAPAGKKFEEITVVYSKSMEEHAKYVSKLATSKGSGGVLVTGSAEVEKLAGSGVRKLRVNTFRKAFDAGGDGEGGSNDRSDNGGNRSRSSRPQRRRQPKQQQNNSGGNAGNNNNTKKNNNSNNEPKRERPQKERSDVDAINELIDLVD